MLMLLMTISVTFMVLGAYVKSPSIIIFNAIVLVVCAGLLALKAMQKHVATAVNPNYKLLITLARWKIIGLSWLFITDEQRISNGLPSIFNNGEGLYIKCENCDGKNEIQRNYIIQMKKKQHQDPDKSEDHSEAVK